MGNENEIFATSSGILSYYEAVQDDGYYFDALSLDHGNGWISVYMHVDLKSMDENCYEIEMFHVAMFAAMLILSFSNMYFVLFVLIVSIGTYIASIILVFWQLEWECGGVLGG